MPELKKFVAVDWRSGKDAIHFFFTSANKYSRFNIGDNEVPSGYPSNITKDNWGDFHTHAKNLRFGFTTTNLFDDSDSSDADSTWLFFYAQDEADWEDEVSPFVCKYDQDADKVVYIRPVERTVWKPLIPYFDKILAGTWWQDSECKMAKFRFIMNDGFSFFLDFQISRQRSSRDSCFRYKIEGVPTLWHEPINKTTWPGLEGYKDRIITAVQSDRSLADNYLYVFLTNNEYIRYNIDQNRTESGPTKINNGNWPGLLRD